MSMVEIAKIAAWAATPQLLKARAEDHEIMYWEHYEKAKYAAARYKRQVEDQRERVRAALDSRGRAVRHLKQVVEDHRWGRSGSTCGNRNCQTVYLSEDNWVREQIRKLEARNLANLYGWPGA